MYQVPYVTHFICSIQTVCISFLSFWSSFFDSFLFYCFQHFLVTHTEGSESKSLHSDWVASLKFSAPFPSFFRHISLMLRINQDRILPHSVRSYATTYLCHLTRCRPKPCIRSVTDTLRETGYSFEIFINIYQYPIPKDRNFNAYRHEKLKSALTVQSIMCWYRKP